MQHKMTVDPDKSILVIGAGTFGLSAALEILRRGHKNLTILDPYPVPSPLSAGNDVNKIFQTAVTHSEFHTMLSFESYKKWKSDDVYKPAFHETGVLYGATKPETHKEIEEDYQWLNEKGFEELHLLERPEDYLKLLNVQNDADLKRFQSWKGFYQKTHSGWMFASLALQRAAQECISLGAKIITDTAEELLLDKSTQKCIGVHTSSGNDLLAERIIIAAGASSVKLFDFEGQLLAKCWTLAHIKLTNDEIQQLKDTPVIIDMDRGFMFEADAFGDLKFCNEFPGYINMEKYMYKTGEKTVSIPAYKDAIPEEAEEQMRDLLRQVHPHLADREFNVAKICWCTDTTDRYFLIDEHPQHEGLIFATGDSGKGFKYMPVVGEYIASVALEGRDALPDEKREAWKWRPEQALNRDIYNVQNRYGGSNKVKDIKDIGKWISAK